VAAGSLALFESGKITLLDVVAGKDSTQEDMALGNDKRLLGNYTLCWWVWWRLAQTEFHRPFG
jgi:hypothetical protein